MIPVTQRIVSSEDGDCFAACLASLLELPLLRVPNIHTPNWHADYNLWLKRRELILHVRSALPAGYCIASVPSRIYVGSYHAIILLDGEVAHDPSPHCYAREGYGPARHYFTLETP